MEEGKSNNESDLDFEAIKSLKTIREENDEIKYYTYSDYHKNVACYKCWTKTCQGRAKGVIVEKNRKLTLDGEIKVLYYFLI